MGGSYISGPGFSCVGIVRHWEQKLGLFRDNHPEGQRSRLYLELSGEPWEVINTIICD